LSRAKLAFSHNYCIPLEYFFISLDRLGARS
jgi:hypothetical protein